MSAEKINKLWGISLMVIAVVSLLYVGSDLVGLELPAAVRITLGVIDLIALPVLVYTSVRKRRVA